MSTEITREWFARHIGRGSQSEFHFGNLFFSLFDCGDGVLRMVAEIEHECICGHVEQNIEVAVAEDCFQAERLIRALCGDDAFQDGEDCFQAEKLIRALCGDDAFQGGEDKPTSKVDESHGSTVLVLRSDRRFTCGTTSFGCKAGAFVFLRQRDENNRKVLLNFGGGLIDWFHESILDEFCK